MCASAPDIGVRHRRALKSVQVLAAQRKERDERSVCMSFVESLFGLRGSIAVVTGGGGALPSSIAVAFAKAGAKVALWAAGRITLWPKPPSR